MIRARKRLITLLIAGTLAIATGVAAIELAGLNGNETEAEAAGPTETQQPVPEALMPPIAPWVSTYGM